MSLGPRVLVAEDDANVLRFLIHFFTLQGCSAVPARSGVEAFEILDRGQPFDLVLSDYDMRCKNGFEVLRKARRHLPKAKALLISSCPFDEAVLQEAAALSANVGLKPFDLEMLKSLVHPSTPSAS